MTTLNRRTLFTAGAGLAGLGVLAACSSGVETAAGDGSADADGVTTLVVGASPVPHAVILEFVRDNLAEDAKLNLEIREYTDYILPNKDLASKDLNANFFQTVPYLETEIKENDYAFTPGKGVHVEPLGLYSEQVGSVAEIPDGAEIAIPNDPTNRGRGLALLADAGLITLADGAGATGASVDQVAENPKNLTFTELEGAMIPRSLSDFAAAVINGNYALEAGLSPAEDAIHIEPGEGNPNANLLVWRTEDDGNAALAKLEELLHTDEVREFIKTTYSNGSVIPAF
ncbi:MAG: MetQ/NlpA family ABC transporter substrate-binding protein [Dermabacter sp.]|nr:MetQ/NlpA family ABC transporter substrate-binding protein [Dermabacter sp.]